MIVYGKPRHPQSQGSIERSNCDIKDMLIAWLADNNTSDWTIVLKFAKFQKNSSHHSGINRTPFAALLGWDAKVGLTTSSLPSEILSKLRTEDDLLHVLDQHNENNDIQSDPPSLEITEHQENIQQQRKRAADSQLQQAEKKNGKKG